MEVLNTARLMPVSFHRSPGPKKLLPFRFPKLPSSDAGPSVPKQVLSGGFVGGVALISSVLTGSAKALTYEEALEESLRTSASFGGFPDVDVAELVDGFLRFGSENPLVIGGGTALLAVTLVLSQVLKEPKPWGVVTAKGAYLKLAEDAGAQLLDIREGKEFKEVGSPDIRNLKKKAASIVYRGFDKPGFLKKLSLKFKDPTNTTLFILDKFDGYSELVAELVTANGFKAAFAVKDGAVGTRGWVNSRLPWSPPKKTLNLDFGDVKDAISSALGEGTDGLPVALGLAAATGLGFLAFSEMGTILQLLGSAAIVQFITKKLLFAEDRKVTLQQLDEFLNTKVAPKELLDEMKMIGKAFLPASTNAKASLPAPVEPSTNTSITPAEKADVPKISGDLKLAAVAEPPQEVNSVPKAEVSSESISGLSRDSRPLSPYPYYPDFKPPSSPCPSPP